MSDEARNNQARFGRILSGVGSIWLLLFFVSNFFDVGGTPFGDILGFFGDSFFIPIALLFAGRAIRRRSGQVPQQTTIPVEPRPPQRRAAKPTSPTPREPTKTERKPAPVPSPEEPDMEELAAAIGFDGEAPDETALARPGEANKDQFKARYEPTYKAKSSEEMLAEARDRLKKKPEEKP